MLLLVFGGQMASWRRCPDAGPHRRTPPRAPPHGVLPVIHTAGYFIVTFEPMFPSTHSMVAPGLGAARLVTRLFVRPVLDRRIPHAAWGLTMISTTAECSESDL